MSFTEKEIKKQIHRGEASGIMKAVHREGAINLDTLVLLRKLLKDAGYSFHIEVVVESGSLLKTIDTQKLATKTISNLDKAIREGKLPKKE